MGNSRSKREDSKYDDEDLSYEEDENALQYLELHLTRLIAYAESADASLQREVAERLANEAVKPERQVQIVDLGGLRLLIPLTRSADGDTGAGSRGPARPSRSSPARRRGRTSRGTR